VDDAPKREVAPIQPSLMDLSTAIAPLTRIRQIRLVKSSIESKPIEIPESSPLQHSFDATASLNQEAGTLDVYASLAVTAGDFLRIEAEFLLNYTIAKAIPIPDEVIAAFGKMNGIHNVWPYWREYVQSVSMRAGFPPVALPLMTGASMLEYYAEKERAAASENSRLAGNEVLPIR
jgi:hypothetical protein